MKTDAQLKADVTSELAWDPSIDANAIGVMVKDGLVTLTGHLDSFAEKEAVERAARRVSGVRGIAVELDVKPSPEHKRSDSEIAKAVLAALRWHSWVPEERVRVEVEHGWVTLSGEVDWRYQATSAEQCIRPLVGVRGLTNNVTIKTGVSEKDISDRDRRGPDPAGAAGGRTDQDRGGRRRRHAQGRSALVARARRRPGRRLGDARRVACGGQTGSRALSGLALRPSTIINQPKGPSWPHI